MAAFIVARAVAGVRTRFLATIAIALFLLASVPLAMAGPELVPATVGGKPRWLLGLYGSGFGLDGRSFFFCFIAAFLAYLGIVATADLVSARVLWTVIGVAIALFLLAPPLLSQDVFSYISYARLGAAHGLNPYRAVPADLSKDSVMPFVGWRDVTSAYGPLFTLGSYPTGLVGVPLALWLFKAVAAVSVLGLAVLVARIAAWRGGNPRRAAVFVGLNPLVLVHVVGGAHNDGTVLLVVIGGIGLLAGKEIASGAAFVGASAMKASAALVAPFAVLGSRRRGPLLAGATAALAATLGLTVAVFGFSAFDAIGQVEGQDQSSTSKYSVPSTISRLVGTGVGPLRIAALVIYGLGVLYLLVRTKRGADWVQASGWAALGLLAATSWLMPWYVIWVLPFAAIAEDGWLVAGALGLCAFQLVNRIPL